jgi:hypothetical protein
MLILADVPIKDPRRRLSRSPRPGFWAHVGEDGVGLLCLFGRMYRSGHDGSGLGVEGDGEKFGGS